MTDIAVAVKGPLLNSVDEGDKPHAVFVALAEELRAMTPTVVVLEDVHWADEATLDVIRLLARRAEALGARTRGEAAAIALRDGLTPNDA